MAAGVQIIGLKDFILRVRRANATLPSSMRRMLNTVGEHAVIPQVKTLMAAKKGGYWTGKLEGTLRARSTQREGRVILGNASTPYAGWWEFGGDTHSPRGGVVRAHEPEGRTMYPAVDAATPQIIVEMETVVDLLAALI